MPFKNSKIYSTSAAVISLARAQSIGDSEAASRGRQNLHVADIQGS